MIRKIKMTNIKKHADLEVEFTDGVNVIVGPNYAGKSSLLHGILFGLFGVRAIPGNADEFWTDDTPNSAVDLNFVVAGTEVLVHRTRTTAALYEDEVMTASGATAVNGRIAELMGMPIADFLRIKYSRQKETAALLSFGATNLNSLIERVGGVSMVKKAMDELTSIANTCKGVLSVKEASELEPLEAAVRDAEKNLDDGLAEAEEFRRELEELSGKVSGAESDYTKAKTARRYAQEHALEQSRLDQTVSTLTEQRDRASEELGLMSAPDDEAINVLKTTADNLGNQLEEVTLENDRRVVLLRRRARHVRLAEGLASEIEQKEAQANLYPLPDLYEATKAMERASAEVEESMDRWRTLDSQLEKGVCSECGRPFEADWDMESAKAERAAEKEKLEKLQLVLKDFIADVKEAKAAALRHKQIMEQKLDLALREGAERTAIATCDEDLKGCPEHSEAELQDLKVRAGKAVKAEKDAIMARKMADKAADALDRLEEELETASEAATDHAGSAPDGAYITGDEVQELEDVFRRLDRQKQELTTALKELGYTCDGLQRELEDAKHSLEVADDDNALVEYTEKRLSDASELKKFLSGNREAFMKHAWDRLLAQASTLCSHATGGVLTSMQRTSDVFSYVEEGRERALASASGGQESLMGLALKVALSESLPDSLSCLLLDEVTADLDEPHSAAVTSLLGSVGCQIITVSHRDMDRSGQFNVISLGA